MSRLGAHVPDIALKLRRGESNFVTVWYTATTQKLRVDDDCAAIYACLDLCEVINLLNAVICQILCFELAREL